MIDADEKLNQIAGLCDIDLVGVVNLEKLQSFRSILEKYENDIAFFRGNIQDKVNYQKIWKNTESIIAFGVSYNQNILPPENMENRGIISKCAYGEDYHAVLKRKAAKMMQLFQNNITKCEYRIFVDTGVLSDRILAYCAGLGFYGNNNFIVNEKMGSYVFYGHILIDSSLKPNNLFLESGCGSCRLCISACPTNALEICTRQLDYRKCISYITQKGKDINTFGYLYGCDLCQDVCPYNKSAQIIEREEFQTNKEEAFPLLEEIINMGEAEYKQRYGRSSMFWRGYNTVKRNAQNIKKNRQV